MAAQDGTRADGQQGGELPSKWREVEMTYGVDPAVKPVEAARADGATDGGAAEPGSAELCVRDQP